MMRNFTFAGLSSSIIVVLALAGCHTDPPRTDAGRGDSGGGTDTGPLPDTGPQPDTNMTLRDTGSTGTGCTYGGGCELLTGMGCDSTATPRQACYPGDTMTMCANAGSAQLGDACMNLNDCDSGLLCLGDGHCAQMCCHDTDCGTGEICSPIGSPTTMMPLPNNTGFCRRPTACTVVPNTGCAAGSQCTLTGSDGSTDCFTVGTATEGTPCGSASPSGQNCIEGLGCYGAAGAAGRCFRFCRIAMGNADCTGTATTCTASGLGTTFGLCM